MNAQLIAGLLWRRRILRQRDRWACAQIEAHQARALKQLRQFALERSPLYRGFHRGFERAPLSELPVLSKA